jgi:hypothetical protein
MILCAEFGVVYAKLVTSHERDIMIIEVSFLVDYTSTLYTDK